MYTLMFWNSMNEALRFYGHVSQLDFDSYRAAYRKAKKLLPEMAVRGATEMSIHGNGCFNAYSIIND